MLPIDPSPSLRGFENVKALASLSSYEHTRRDILYFVPSAPEGGEMTTLEEFSELVTAIYDAGLDPSLWEQTLKQIATAAGGSSGSLVVYDRQRGRRPQKLRYRYRPSANSEVQ